MGGGRLAKRPGLAYPERTFSLRGNSMMTYSDALGLLAKNGVEGGLLQHSTASAADMAAQARHYGEY